MKSFFIVFAFAFAATALSVLAQTAKPAEVSGKYANYSENSFVYKLDLSKDGQAIYREADPEGGKSLTLKGKWSVADGLLTVDFGKKGRYTYKPQSKLSWESFGCREATSGLEIQSTPRGKSKDPSFHVWLAEDLKRAERCRRI